MTHPDLVSILLGCFVFFAFFAFVIANAMLGAKRVAAWWGRLQNRRNPPSVALTLNQMNVDAEGRGFRLSEHARIEQGGKHGHP